jgi:glyoxylase-like metal-dependent hydrolase (beta-lactamase superfamily II)
MNVYFLEQGDGVVQFDAGTKAMRRAAAFEARQLGGLQRVVLSHAHADHRGTAPYLGVPVQCHADEVADAESDVSIQPYMDLSLLPLRSVQLLYRFLLPHWDGGAVRIDSTLAEGDEVAGFEVLHFPGHTPGLIGLWRERDRLAIVSDVVYLVDSARLRPLPEGEATVPHPAFSRDHEGAKQSLRRLAALEPRTVAAGHARPLRGENLRETLARAADKP